MLNLFTKIAIQSVASPSSIAYLTNIMEGVDGSSVFGYNVETEDIKISDGQTQQYAQIHTLDIRVLDEDANSSIIDAIIASGGTARISGYGPNGFFVWNDPVQLVRNKQYDNVVASAVLATIKATPGFRGSPPSRAVHAGRNLMGVYGVDNMTTSEINNQRIFFPFPGVTLFATATGPGIIGLSAYNSAGTLILDEQQDIDLPANTVFVGTAGSNWTLPMVTINNPDSNFVL